MVLVGKLDIYHMHELKEMKRQSDLISLMIFSVKMTQFFVDDFQCRNDLVFINDFQCHDDIISVDDLH